MVISGGWDATAANFTRLGRCCGSWSSGLLDWRTSIKLARTDGVFGKQGLETKIILNWVEDTSNFSNSLITDLVGTRSSRTSFVSWTDGQFSAQCRQIARCNWWAWPRTRTSDFASFFAEGFTFGFDSIHSVSALALLMLLTMSVVCLILSIHSSISSSLSANLNP